MTAKPEAEGFAESHPWGLAVHSQARDFIKQYSGPQTNCGDSVQKYDYDAITSIPGRLALADPPLKVVQK